MEIVVLVVIVVQGKSVKNHKKPAIAGFFLYLQQNEYSLYYQKVINAL